MSAYTTTTLKLPTTLEQRLIALAEKSGRSPHGLMVEAIERHAEYEERVRAFVAEAVPADRDIERTGEVYAAADVHAWLERLAQGKKTRRPKLNADLRSLTERRGVAVTRNSFDAQAASGTRTPISVSTEHLLNAAPEGSCWMNSEANRARNRA